MNVGDVCPFTFDVLNIFDDDCSSTKYDDECLMYNNDKIM